MHLQKAICILIIAIRTVFATTFTAIASLQMVLFRKNSKPLFCHIKITFSQFNFVGIHSFKNS